MKKSFLLLISISTVVIVSILSLTGTAISIPLYTSGPPSGFSGDPAGGNLNCTNCHSGPEAEMQADWIVSDVPESGYVPEQTYTITATAARSGHNKFGFQISAQKTDGTSLGTLGNINTETKLNSDPSYINHTSAGTDGGGSKTWTFNWTAPAKNSGAVTFYGAFLATNRSGSNEGDTTFLSILSVDEVTSVGIDSKDQNTSISIYPNPVTDICNIDSRQALRNADVSLYNSSGQLVKMLNTVSGNMIQLHRDDLPAGQYFINITENNKVIYSNSLMIVNN